MLIKCFKHCSDDVKILLFKTFCCSMYCSHLWSCFSTVVFRKLKTAFNRIFRTLMCLDRRASISKAMLDSKINTFDINVRKYIYSFMVRLSNSSNLVICTLLNSLHYMNSTIVRHWHKKLYV